jgi:conjugal transfer pilus assembly protein TraF
MIKSLVTYLVAIAMILPIQIALADSLQHKANSEGYNPAEGFHFYDVPKTPEDVIAEKIVEKLIKATPSDKQDKPGSSAWIKKHLPDVRRTAADDPTTENVRALLIMEKILRDKGRRLARRAAMISQTDPYLDTSYKPTANIAMARDRRSSAIKGKEELVQKLVSEGVSLWIFVSGDCKSCERWVSTLATLTEKYKMKILWILDPKTVLPTPPEFTDAYWEYREAKGERASLGVKSDIAMFAYHQKEKQYVLLSQGFVPISAFSHKLIISADFSGWVSPAEVDRTLFRVNKQDLAEPDTKGFKGDYSKPVEYSNYIYEQLLKGQ